MDEQPLPASSFPPVKKREIFGWCCFDFANSAFTTVIITVVYSVYFLQVVAENDPQAKGWWATALALSQVVVIFLSPLIGAVADVTARKKRYLFFTALVCALATMSLFWVGKGDVWLALGLVMVANLAFSLSENLCAAFLPEISTAENVGRISSYGWSFGYFGGLLSLVLAIAIIESGPGRASWTFVMTGAFFLVASLPTLLLLRERAVPKKLQAGETYLVLGCDQLRKMRHELPKHHTVAVFFGAMTLFISGLMAVVNFAAVFMDEALAMSQPEIIKMFIVLQLAGVAGAFGFGWLQDRIGSKIALVASLIIWVVVSIWAAVCQTKGEFFYVGILAGIAMGSLQSSGRAVVSALTPAGRSGEFFGYWGFFGKLAGVIGPLVFGWLATWFNSRVAVGVNALFFLAGLAIVLTLRFPATKSAEPVSPR